MKPYDQLLNEIVEEGKDVESMKVEIVSEYALDDDLFCEMLVNSSKELATFVRQYAEGVSVAGVWALNMLTKQIMAHAKQTVDQKVWERSDGVEQGYFEEERRLDDIDRAKDMNSCGV